MTQRRRQATGNDFLPPHLQRVVAVSCVLRSNDGIRVWSLGSPQDAEALVIQRFFDGIEKYKPQLVSWNGSGFDLPVLHYRALIHGIPGCCYWDQGENDREFKFNNYLSRFHARHTDLMDVVAGMAKTPFFGAIIALVGCHFGITTTGGTAGVGNSTTRTVVTISIAILIADFFLTKLAILLWPSS